MKTGVFLLSAVLACAALVAVAGDKPAVPTWVFVGERLSIEETPDPCQAAFRETGTLTCLNLDSLYRARYRVSQPVVGTPGDQEVSFGVADHYGFPPFARFRHALLFVAMHEDGPWLHKYQAIPVHLTIDGQWASCGDVVRAPDGTSSAQLKPLRFAQEIAEVSDLSEPMLESYRAGQRPEWRIERGKVWCSQGVLLEDLYAIVRDGVMQARGVPLPEWPH